MRVAFAGTPEFAARALSAVLDAGFEVPLVLTQPDRPAGRGMQPAPSPVKQLALAQGLPVDQPPRLKDPASHAALRAANADVMVVAAYGLILPQAVLDIPRRGCLNIHASLLPRWRGAAPIQRAIEAGDRESGITIMAMDAGLDTGAMLLQESEPINADDTAASLHDRLAALGAQLVVRALRGLDSLVPVPQPAQGASYAHKVEKAEGVLDWRLPACRLARRVRAFDPFPGTTATINGMTLKIWSAAPVPGDALPGQVLATGPDGIDVACGVDALRLRVLQKPGSRRLPASEFLRGFRLAAGDRFAVG